MNDPETAFNYLFEQDALEMMDDEDECDDASCSEHEKESYIKHIKQDLCQYKTFCPTEAMAKAIGGAFTANFVHDICHDEKWQVQHFMRQGKCLVVIEPFLEKLKGGLSFDNAPEDGYTTTIKEKNVT